MLPLGTADGRRSQLLRGFLTLSLAVISEGPAYGYEMTSGSAHVVSPICW